MKSVLYVFLISVLGSCAYQNEAADLIVHNALIYSCDEGFSMHHAMAIKDGKIIEIGAERQIVNKYYADEVIDNLSRPIYPSFIEVKDPIRKFASTARKLKLLMSDRRDVLLTLTRFKALEELIEDYGTLKTGMRANFFITDLDLLTIKPEHLSQVKVLSIYKDGKRLE